MKRLTGLFAAPFTAFNESGEIDLDIIGSQFSALSANAVSGAIVCGTTGESSSLTNIERMAVLEEWCKAARTTPEFDVIAHVGHTSLKDCVELTRHAVEAGADVIASLPPYYFRPESVGDLLDFFSEIAAAAANLPFYYYHMPSMTGVNFDVFDILSELNGRIPNFAGVKYTYEDLYDLARCMDLSNGRYDILCGRDEILLACLALGTTGAVGSTYNYIAPVYIKMIAAFEAGDLVAARQMQKVSRDVIAIMVKYGGLPAAKQIMKLVGLNCGDARTPLAKLSADAGESMAQELKAAGFYEYCSVPPSTAASAHISEA